MDETYKVNKIYSKTKFFIGFFMIISVATALVLVLTFVYSKYQWINVHLIPHSHDDVGWLQSPEEYYKYYVKYILDHVVLELQKNPRRRFVYSETYYFWKWWQEQTDLDKMTVRILIEKKQLEIVGGGWCMSDEAVSHYQSFIDMSTWGFRRLNDTFGPAACPKAAWQIDTFGHSKGIASLLAQMGFESLYFARINFNERKYRKANKLMEFFWVANEYLGDYGSIFTSIFYNHYSAPNGFDFEEQPFQDGIEYNAFYTYARKHASYFKTNNILVPMGDDFRFFNAKKYFYKLDQLISFFEKNPDFGLNVFYSTPTEYLYSLKKANVRWPVNHGDFFPYASDFQTFWTGYYTSRPSIKYFERISNNILQVTKQLLVFTGLGMKYFENLTIFREAMGVMQHHDAITGTSQQEVANHYTELVYAGIKSCETPVDQALGKLTTCKERPKYESCLLLNISSCDVTENSSRFVVTVYNSLSRCVNHFVRVPVSGRRYSVWTSRGEKIKAQMVAIPKSVRSIPGRTSTAKTELVFRASGLPAMGFKSYYVSLEEYSRSFKRSEKHFTKKKLKLSFDPRSQLLLGIKSKAYNISLFQTVKYYKSADYASGAYLFRPANTTTFSLGSEVTTKVLNNGELVKEYEQIFSDWASQIVRVYKDEEYVEFEWLVGPIPISDRVGKEVILIYNTNIKSKNIFYTDANGMEMMKRKRNFVDSDTVVLEKLAGNYYPVTSMISIEDELGQLFVLVDRPEGGSSLRSGQIELMVHRRMNYDDGKGVEEALNEMAYGFGLVVRGRHWILFGRKEEELSQKAKLLAQLRHSEPWLFFLDATCVPFNDWRANYVTEFSGIQTYVPPNIRILTLEPWRENTVLLRLEHVFDTPSKHRTTENPPTVCLKDLLRDFDILEARETTLGANQWMSESPNFRRCSPSNVSQDQNCRQDPEVDNMTVTLLPHQIRTFILTVRLRP